VQFGRRLSGFPGNVLPTFSEPNLTTVTGISPETSINPYNNSNTPTPVAARNKDLVFSRSLAKTAGSNPTKA